MLDMTALLEQVRGQAPLDVIISFGKALAIPLMIFIVFFIVVMSILWVVFGFKDEAYIIIYVISIIALLIGIVIVFPLAWIYLT